MNMQKRTLAPWVQADFGKYEWEILIFGIDEDENGNAKSFNVARAHRIADAKLISAAPDLLEALKAILKHDIPGIDPKIYELAEDAIHKAEGKT
jgi:hypothetical protein